MKLFLDIFVTSALPIFILMAVGAVVDRFFRLDIPTLSRLNFYVASPALMFNLIYQSDLLFSEIFLISGFVLSHMLVMFLLGLGVFFRKSSDKRTVLGLSGSFYNTAVYGIPLMLHLLMAATVAMRFIANGR